MKIKKLLSVILLTAFSAAAASYLLLSRGRPGVRVSRVDGRTARIRLRSAVTWLPIAIRTMRAWRVPVPVPGPWVRGRRWVPPPGPGRRRSVRRSSCRSCRRCHGRRLVAQLVRRRAGCPRIDRRLVAAEDGEVELTGARALDQPLRLVLGRRGQRHDRRRHLLALRGGA